MLGDEQESWLLEGLAASERTWKVIGQQVMMGELTVREIVPEPVYNDDQWDGYPLARNRLLGTVADSGIQNVVVLSGDLHSAWVNDLKADFLDDGSPVVASELVAPSISAENPIGQALALAPLFNPATRFVDLRHGYVRCTVRPGRWEADFRAVESAADPDDEAAGIASFVIESGAPGAQPA
jgi:alkaline phosphatase D